MRAHEQEQRERPLPTGTVTLLLSDVEGSTRLWDADEEAAAAAIARHYELFAAAIGTHRGVRPVEQGEGDSVVAAFALASDALAAAVFVQRAFARRRGRPNGPCASALPCTAVRSGSEMRTITSVRRSSAAPDCGLAHGGQTLFSDAVRDLVVDGLAGDVSLRNLGPQRLKDLGRPERVWQLCHPDLEVEFPPLRSLDAVPEQPAGPVDGVRRPRHAR